VYEGTRDVATEDKALEAFGLKRDGPPPDDASVRVWPENWQAFRLFVALSTQWNVGMGGPTGIRYESIPTVLRLRAVPRGEWSLLFEQLRTMESEALKYFAERRNG
jgi:hypothetical protein